MESKTRRLRKYEAETTPWAVDVAEPAMDYLSPFGPMIARLRLPTKIVDRINRYADSRVLPDRSTGGHPE